MENVSPQDVQKAASDGFVRWLNHSWRAYFPSIHEVVAGAVRDAARDFMDRNKKEIIAAIAEREKK